jgi:hypothetical protein
MKFMFRFSARTLTSNSRAIFSNWDNRVYEDNLRAAFGPGAKVTAEDLGSLELYGKQLLVEFNDNKSPLCIAWATLGNGERSEGNSMGNVYAYDACVALTAQFCPKFILLLGVAGGSSTDFSEGDVGFGFTTGFCPKVAKLSFAATRLRPLGLSAHPLRNPPRTTGKL